MKSHYNRKIIFLITFLAVLFLLQTAISHLINNSKDKILNYANSTFGYSFELEDLSFSLLRGLHIKGAALTRNNYDKKIIFIKDAFISLKILPLFFKTLDIKVHINELSLFIKREGEGINTQIIFSEINKKMPKHKPSLDISIEKTRIITGDNPNLSIILKDSKIRQESQSLKMLTLLEFDYRLAPDSYLAHLFSDNYIRQTIKCLVQAHINGDNLHLDYILLNIEGNEIIGAGLNKDFTGKNPYLYINFMHSMVLLNKLTVMKRNFKAQGNVYFSLGLKGRMDAPSINISSELSHCSFVIAKNRLFNIEELQGKIEYQNNLINLNNASLRINNVHLNIHRLIAGLSVEPELKLELSFPQEFFDYNSLPLNKLRVVFEGRLKQFLSGDLGVSALYIRDGRDLDMQAHFNGINLSFQDAEKNLTVGSIELIKNDDKIQKISLRDLKSQVYLEKNRIDLKNISVAAYDNSLSGELKISLTDPAALNLRLKGQGLDLKSVMQDTNISDKLLSGRLDVEIVFDNLQKEFLQGNCYIKNGSMDLNMLGSIIALPALKNTKFQNMHADFSISKQLVSLKDLEMHSPDIMLGLSWNTNHKVDGELKLSMASRLLKQYAAFKKLLNIAKFKKDYVDFSFLLAGTSRGNTRILWQKGEFKAKLKENLPNWVQKRIEKELDKIVDSL